MKIVPAILVTELSIYSTVLRAARQLTNRFHIDIIDGKYVENMTVQPCDIQKQIDNKMDMHLMVNDPLWYARECISLNPYTVILQYESEGDADGAIELVKKNGFRAGLSINPDTPVSVLKDYSTRIDYVQVMGYPAGFAGQKLQKEVLEKPHQIRDLRADIEVGLDGGVNDKNIKAVVKAEFDIINVNSFLFDNIEQSPMSAYSNLLESTL